MIEGTGVSRPWESVTEWHRRVPLTQVEVAAEKAVGFKIMAVNLRRLKVLGHMLLSREFSFIFLTRRCLIRRALSYYRMAYEGVTHIDARSEKHPGPRYVDGHCFEKMLRRAYRHQKVLNSEYAHLRNLGAKCIECAYEDIVENPEQRVNAVFDFLDVQGQCVDASRLKKIGSQDWRQDVVNVKEIEALSRRFKSAFGLDGDGSC